MAVSGVGCLGMPTNASREDPVTFEKYPMPVLQEDLGRRPKRPKEKVNGNTELERGESFVYFGSGKCRFMAACKVKGKRGCLRDLDRVLGVGMRRLRFYPVRHPAARDWEEHRPQSSGSSVPRDVGGDRHGGRGAGRGTPRGSVWPPVWHDVHGRYGRAGMPPRPNNSPGRITSTKRITTVQAWPKRSKGPPVAPRCRSA
jgi:hypothetical protein